MLITAPTTASVEHYSARYLDILELLPTPSVEHHSHVEWIAQVSLTVPASQSLRADIYSRQAVTGCGFHTRFI